MRVVGYVRESPGPHPDETAFAQSEAIRRWAATAGHHIVALCQDIKTPGHALGREGFVALLGILGAGQVDGVVVTSLDVLSPDLVIQEIMLWDLRTRGVRLLSTSEADLPALVVDTEDQSRMLIRDVLARVSEHSSELHGPHPTNEVIDLRDDPAQVGIEEPVRIEMIVPETTPSPEARRADRI